MRTFRLRGPTGRCLIQAGGDLGELEARIGQRRTVVVTDPVVRGHHGVKMGDREILEVGVGEASKTLDTVRALYDGFLRLGLDRSCLIVGFGGGVVCDIAGFAASTFHRGLSFGFVPTTLLAQVDAAIGGKNGVNLDGFKNLVGVVRQPEFVLCDGSLLQTLPAREIACGFAEVVKHAAIADSDLFAHLETHASEAVGLAPAALSPIIERAVAVKVRVVSGDEMETGHRKILNFGHTLGHALEKTAGLPHGESVAVGMVAAARLSADRGLITKPEASRIERLLALFGLPTRLPDVPKEALLEAVARDKKRHGGRLDFVLLDRIGNAVVEEASVAVIAEVLDDLRQPG